MTSYSEETVPLTPDQEKLVNDFTHVAKNAAKRRHRTAPHALEEADLLSDAYTGLVQAAKRWRGYCADMTVEREAKQAAHLEEFGTFLYPPDRVRFDPNRLDFFAVYASRRCDGAIMDALRARDYATRSLRAKSKKLRAAGQDEGVSISELARITGYTPSEVSQIINDMQNRPVSLDAEDSDFEVPQTTESRNTVHTILLATATAIQALSPAEQVVLALHYYQTRENAKGDKMVNLQLQQVATLLNVPEGYVSKLHTDGVLSVHEKMLEAAKGVLSDD